MATINEDSPFNHLPADDLSPREIQLLHAHLDGVRAARWRQVAGPKPVLMRAFSGGKKWARLAAAACLSVVVCWLAGWFSGIFKTRAQEIAARAEILDYPFENTIVRGENDLPVARSPKAVADYRKKDFSAAIREAGPTDHFFVGMCWLYLHDDQKALAEFERVAPETGIGDEVFYYKGLALQGLGRAGEAKKAFQQVIESRSVREPFRAAARERMGGPAF